MYYALVMFTPLHSIADKEQYIRNTKPITIENVDNFCFKYILVSGKEATVYMLS